jgi:hypothetical protein
MSLVLLILGVAIMAVGGIMFLVAAFRESTMWGIGCLLFSPVSLIFLILHWQEAKKPFLIQLAGLPFVVLAVLLADPATPSAALPLLPMVA